MPKWITVPVGISLMSLIVATTVWIFGNNISDRFRKANLVYDSYSVDLKYPTFLDFDKLTPPGKTVPNYYREILIKNVGSKPSKALKLIMNLDGMILDKEIKCIETYDTIKAISSNQLQLKFDRLVRKADIKCKIWLKHSVDDFSITLIDDDGVVVLQNAKDVNKTNYIFIFSSIAIVVILFVLTYLILIKPARVENTTLKQRLEDAESKRLNLETELSDLNTRAEAESTTFNGDLISRLKAMIVDHESKDV